MKWMNVNYIRQDVLTNQSHLALETLKKHNLRKEFRTRTGTQGTLCELYMQPYIHRRKGKKSGDTAFCPKTYVHAQSIDFGKVLQFNFSKY